MNKVTKKNIVIFTISVLAFCIGGCVMAGNGNKDGIKSVWMGNMNYFHDHPPDNAFLLPDGKVLLTGETAEVFDSRTKKFKVVGTIWSALPSGTVIHAVPKATMLKDGRILLTGGVTFRQPNIYTLSKSAQIFDPKTGKTEKVADMNFGRSNHAATLLKDGKVLITGKDNNIKKAELFDPATNEFTVIPNEMIYPRTNHITTLMNNGEVLLVGGALDKTNTYHNQAEIYNPETNSFYEVGNLNINREGYMSSLKSVLLNNGNILICGGADPNRGIGIYKQLHIPCEVYDYKTQKFRLLNNFNEPRYDYSITKLLDGRVLIAGGVHGTKYKIDNIIDSIEIFNPSTEKFTTIGKMKKTRKSHLSVLLKDNAVLLGGGYYMVVKNDWEFLVPIHPDSHNKDAEILKVNNIGDK